LNFQFLDTLLVPEAAEAEMLAMSRTMSWLGDLKSDTRIDAILVGCALESGNWHHDLSQAIRAVGNQKLSYGNRHIFAPLTKPKQVCCWVS